MSLVPIVVRVWSLFEHKRLAKANRIIPGYAHIVMVLPVADETHMLHDCPVLQPHRQHQHHVVGCRPQSLPLNA